MHDVLVDEDLCSLVYFAVGSLAWFPIHLLPGSFSSSTLLLHIMMEHSWGGPLRVFKPVTLSPVRHIRKADFFACSLF